MSNTIFYPVNSIPIITKNEMPQRLSANSLAGSGSAPTTHFTHFNNAWAWQPLSIWPASADETQQVDWLIAHFNSWFAHRHVVLM
ncbi:MAG: hypothetical protein EOO68_12460, partial [Moraxellaceae bacterium]